MSTSKSTCLALISGYVRKVSLNLLMREKYEGFNLAGGSVLVNFFENDVTLFKAIGHKLSPTRDLSLISPNGTPILTVSDTVVSFRDRKTIRLPSGDTLFTLRRKKDDSKVVKVFQYSDQEDKEKILYNITGNFPRKEYQIVHVPSGRVVAMVKRRILGDADATIFLDRYNYILTVEAGVNIALMVLFALAVDERSSDW